MSSSHNLNIWKIVLHIILIFFLTWWLLYAFDVNLYTTAVLASNSTDSFTTWYNTPAKDLTVRGLTMAIIFAEIVITWIKIIFGIYKW